MLWTLGHVVNGISMPKGSYWVASTLHMLHRVRDDASTDQIYLIDSASSVPEQDLRVNSPRATFLYFQLCSVITGRVSCVEPPATNITQFIEKGLCPGSHWEAQQAAVKIKLLL